MYQVLNNCGTQVSGTGLGNCSRITKGNQIGGFFIPKNTKLTALNKLNLENLLKAGKLHAIYDAVNPEYGDLEDSYATSNDKTQSKVQDAKPTETLKFWNGDCYYTAIATLESYNEYDFIRVFEKGVELVNYSATELKGFDLGMVTIPEYKEQVGDEQAEAMIKYQYVDATERKSKRIFFPWNNLDFNKNEFRGIIESEIEVISNTAGTLTIKIHEKCNSNNDVTTLVPAVAGSFTLTGGTITTVTLTNGKLVIAYTGTATAIKLNIVEDVNGNFYKSGTSFLA